MRKLHEAKPEAIVHCGFGFGIVLLSPALAQLDWDPPRYMGTAFQNAWIHEVMWRAIEGWTGCDQYDEANPVGQEFLDYYESAYGRRPEYCVPVVNHDVATRAAARVRRRPSVDATRGEGGARAGQDAPGRGGRARDPGVVRQVDPPGLDGCGLPRRPATREQSSARRAWWAGSARSEDDDPAGASRRGCGRQRTPPRAGRARAGTRRGSAWAGDSSSARSPASSSSWPTTPERGARPPGSRTPTCEGAPRPVRPLFGWTHWITFLQISHRRGHGADHRRVRRAVAAAAKAPGPAHGDRAAPTLVWQDPIMNWAPYAVYNPQLWHWPETWPLVSLSPTVEPFIVIGYVMFYLAPFFPAIFVLRRLQRTRTRGLVRLAASAGLAGRADLRLRVRLRRGAGDPAHPDAALHLLTGHPVRLRLHRQDRTSSRCCGSRRWSPPS